MSKNILMSKNIKIRHKLRKRFLFYRNFDCINEKNMYYNHD